MKKRSPSPLFGQPVSELDSLVAEQEAAGKERILANLKHGGGTIMEISAATGAAPRLVHAVLEQLHREHVVVHEEGGRYSIGTTLSPAFAEGRILEYHSRKDNTFVFGALGDSHLGSKYERLDVLNDLYDRYAAAGVDRVFHTGNWIDGTHRINRHELNVHGMEPQLEYLAKNYPARKGLTTYAVAGEDHEGWYTRAEAIDIGQRAEDTMRRRGREDWVNLGFMEAHVKLVNANTGASSILAVVHPGGGTAYALTYSVQKIIEALEGGEKPAVALYGHYHKLFALNIRNVWCLCTGCQQDQTVFTRNKIKTEVHVGGALVRLEQDPKTGAIIGFEPKMWRYFVQSFYNDRWSRAGRTVLPARATS